MSLVKRIKSVFNVWYMDDGTLDGNADALLTDFEIIVKEAKNFGLTVSTSKCELITDDDDIVRQFRAVVPDINHVNTSDAMLLGAPIGSEQSVVEVLTVKLHELRRLSVRISQFNAHDALFLLKNCFSIPKLTYTLRSAPCYTQQLLSKYDDIIRSTLQSILNISIPDMTWAKLHCRCQRAALEYEKRPR
jgi:hypothetical protein